VLPKSVSLLLLKKKKKKKKNRRANCVYAQF